MLSKVALWFPGIVFTVYGLICLINPGLPAGYAGFGLNSGDTLVEIGAMYGGLQLGFGVFCLLGALQRDLSRPVLISIVLLVGGLALGRLYSTLMGSETVGGYTYGALVFEFTTTILAGLALRKS